MTLRGNSTGGRVDDHGGSIGRARALFADALEPWIDLSTGINPHSYPLFDLPATALTRLPEPSRLQNLLAVAAEYYRAPSSDNVVAAPGTQILLPQIMALMEPGRAKILGPTYAEHARAAVIAGHGVSEVRDFAALGDAEIAVVVNPNNPDGRLVARNELLRLAETLGRKGGLLVVDEAFMDVCPSSASVATDTGLPGLVVLRSFGKFFGLAGVRLGFALAEKTIIQRLEGALGPWAVSGPALEYGLRALADRPWHQATREALIRDAARLDALFGDHEISVAGGTTLYRFLDMADAVRLFEALGRSGILLRNFSWSRSALRCGLPSDETQWQRLEHALSTWSASIMAQEEKRA